MATSPFAAELERRNNPFAAELQSREQTTGGEAFGLNMSKGFADNVMAMPAATGDLLTAASERAPAGMHPLMDLAGQAGPLLSKIPRPTTNDLAAGFGSLPALMPGGDSFGDRFGSMKAELEAKDAAMQEQHPIASASGEVVGDIATIVTGRMPMATRIGEMERKVMARTAQAFKNPTARQEIVSAVDKVLKSKAVNKLIVGTGRAAEVGAEAMVLDAVKGDDPFETVGYAVGSQIAASAFFTSAGIPGQLLGAKSKGVHLMLAAGTLGAAIALMDNFTGIGPDSFTRQMDSALDKISLFVAIGAAASPFSRVRSQTSPRLTDALTSIPRSGIISIMERLVNEPEKAGPVGEVLERVESGKLSKKEADAIFREIEAGTLPDNVGKYVMSRPPELGNGKK